MNWKDGIVAIFTPVKVPAGSGVVGTGTPIGNGLVLTARHVVMPDDRSDAPIRLVHWFAAGAEKCAPDLDDKSLIVWESKTHDLALLRCPTPPNTTISFLDPRKPREGEAWSSMGFPAAASMSGFRPPASFGGTILASADSEARFDVLASADKRPDSIEGWKGASGMPVVADGKVIGVCVETMSGFGTGTIRAAPLWQVWKDPQFQAHVQPQNQFSAFENKLSDVIAELFSSESAREALNGVLSQAPLNLTRYAKPGDERKMAADLLKCSAGDIVDALFAMLEKLAQSCPDKMAGLNKVINIVAPVVFGFNNLMAAALSDSVAGKRAFFAEIPIGTETMAELVVAAAEQRESDFVPRRHENDYPPGKHWIPIEFEMGRDDAGGRLTRCILRELSAATGQRHNSELADSRVSPAVRQYLSKSRNLPFDPRELSVQMEVRRKRRKPLPYLAVSLPANPDETEYILNELRGLQAELPLLTIIILGMDYRAEDYRKLEGFTFLLPMQETT